MAAVKVFISYAHEDADLKDQLLQHLAGLMNDGLIQVWHDRDIQGGENWARSIDNALEVSSIVLLLISPSFLASRYSYGPELRRALQKASAGEAKVIPIILRPSDWQTKDLRDLQALPHDGRAVTSWSNLDEGFLEVIAGLRKIITQLPSAVDPSLGEPGTAPGEAIRYYLYISDAKVDMLLPQIGVDADITPRDAMGRSDGTRIQRLNLVRRYLERHSRIGSIDDPGDYVYGTRELYWGHFHGTPAAHESTTPPIVAFCGTTPSTTLLMCGTTRHLIGSHRPDDPGYSSSHVPYLLGALSTAVELDGASPDSIARRDSHTTEEEKLPKQGRELALWLIQQARWHMSGVEQRLEFLAKPLLSGRDPRGGNRCLLASPLYVALAL